MTAACIMVLGTSSGAGKSWLATALCRYYAAKGYRVAPFKAQNMSNNARVVPTPRGEWGEIGSAQYFQALAARAIPDVRMNPVLLKPEADTRSQVVLMGQVNQALTDMPWRGRSEHVWPAIQSALDALRAENDIVVIEGAGSPAEINLHASDIVNMRVARHANAACLLVTDIDRGGAFAHLYGTWALLPPDEQRLIRGFILNRFRGDPLLLAPAPRMLEDRTGVPTVATVPMLWQHGLPEEDGVFDDRTSSAGAIHTTVAVVAYPRISNLDEFQPLKNIPGLRLVWARTPAQLAGADWVILPGSKHTSADLQWLREQGLDQALEQHARAGRRVLGICGGLQMLGQALVDLHGIDGNAPGLGLLALATQFEPRKVVQQASTVFADDLAGPWQALASVRAAGYEIHHGQTIPHPACVASGQAPHVAMRSTATRQPLGWCHPQGHVMGLYLHGLFEEPAVLQALFGAQVPTLDRVFDRLATHVSSSFAPSWLDALVKPSL